MHQPTELLDYLLDLLPTRATEIEKIIMALENNATGTNGIKSHILKDEAKFIAKPMIVMVTLSLKPGAFLSLLQKATVTPIYKSKEKQPVPNYRPVSVLTSLSKVFERAYYTRLYSYLTMHKLIYMGSQV